MKLIGKYENSIKDINMILKKRRKLSIRQRMVHRKILVLNIWFIDQLTFMFPLLLDVDMFNKDMNVRI